MGNRICGGESRGEESQGVLVAEREELPRYSCLALQAIFQPMNHKVSDEVGNKRDGKEKRAEHEQNSVVMTAENSLSEFRGDGGGNSARGIEQIPGNNAGVAAGHEDD